MRHGGRWGGGALNEAGGAHLGDTRPSRESVCRGCPLLSRHVSDEHNMMLLLLLLAGCVLHVALSISITSLSSSPFPLNVPSSLNCSNDTEVVKFLLFNRAATYNRNVLPSFPVSVRIEMWIQEVSSVSELTQDFEIGGAYSLKSWLSYTLCCRSLHEW